MTVRAHSHEKSSPSRDLKEATEGTMWVSGEGHPRQRDPLDTGPEAGAAWPFPETVMLKSNK